jgi:hypothetical protein
VNDKLTAEEALWEIGQVSRSMQRAGRWVVRWLLVLGVSSTIYWLAMFFGSGLVQILAAVAWVLLTIGSCVYVFSQRVHTRRMQRLQWPI